MPTTTHQTRLDDMLRQVAVWAQDNWPSNGLLEQYLAGAGSIGQAIIGLSTMGMRKCGQGLLAARHEQPATAIVDLASGFARRAISGMICIENLKGTRRMSTGDLDAFTNLALGCLALGHPGIAMLMHQSVMAGLRGGYGVRDGHHPHNRTTLRYSAFGLGLIGDWLGQPLDLERYALPADPTWQPLVSLWRDPELDRLLPALLMSCDAHVARIGHTEREADSKDFEFCTPLLAAHPTEVLAILRLRDQLNLPNPERMSHPLMETPYARITCRAADLVHTDKPDALLDRFLEVARQRDPGALPAGL